MRLPSMRRKRLSGCTPTKMFSATLRSGKRIGSWKMIAIPAACDCLALSKIASSPSRTRRPASGRWTPARIFTSVDLPAPFSPTSPCTSPAKSSMCPSSSARTAPKLFSAWSRTSSGSASAFSSVEMEDLLELQQALVRPPPFEPLEEAAHLGLPAGVHLGLLHRTPRRLEVVALDVADEHARIGEEEGVVAPARRRQRGAQLGPDRSVPLAVFRDPVRLHLKLKAHALHSPFPQPRVGRRPSAAPRHRLRT